ncbi:response regulator receiver domain-containing protein [Pontibacter ummariensis]|uniref:Response regulator receiver domain-containing protein n=2 Tax=Pontibacter ummariensis TaxID=1610492 RepID=A0A239E769_9BACT|nr:response regulator receiver domain-containing protein [Pontibacter ummariensis]SNS40281.1 Response regulator receiver domain-containing protein [Pontibacter ummariensis]
MACDQGAVLIPGLAVRAGFLGGAPLSSKEELCTQPLCLCPLALCKKIIKSHQGRLWVANESGKGARFSFTLPLKHKTMSKEKEKLKVLVVDDEPSILMPLEFLMRKNGYQVFIARNGVEAMESVNRELPKVVVLDIMMPEMDGYEVCRHIRGKPEMSGAKVIFLSAKTKEADIKKGYAVGADLYILKPFSTRFLMEKIKDLTAC